MTANYYKARKNVCHCAFLFHLKFINVNWLMHETSFLTLTVIFLSCIINFLRINVQQFIDCFFLNSFYFGITSWRKISYFFSRVQIKTKTFLQEKKWIGRRATIFDEGVNYLHLKCLQSSAIAVVIFLSSNVTDEKGVSERENQIFHISLKMAPSVKKESNVRKNLIS